MSNPTSTELEIRKVWNVNGVTIPYGTKVTMKEMNLHLKTCGTCGFWKEYIFDYGGREIKTTEEMEFFIGVKEHF